MCGIFGTVWNPGRKLGGGALLSSSELLRIQKALSHRGPDGEGSWSRENALLAHTRLAIRDLEHPGAAQPMTTPCGRFGLVYNGELYNDRALRGELEERVRARTGGVGFQTACDGETVLWSLVLGGAAALEGLRGIYALGFVDLERRTLLLARDPLGVKPLVWSKVEASRGGGVAFASEPRALLAHPGVNPRPDPLMIGTYLATSRRTFAGRTLFEGIRSVEPGAVLSVDLEAPEGGPREVLPGSRFASSVGEFDPESVPAIVRQTVREAVLSQLVSDVPVCAFLSGGLDSAILTRIAADERRRAGSTPLATWCASASEEGELLGPDASFARRFGEVLGSHHRDVATDAGRFTEEWRAHVGHLFQPLSTPNEIAIAETARAISASGAKVALSGEGADELFGGYDAALAGFAAHGAMEAPPIDPARFHLEITSWVSPAALVGVMGPSGQGAVDFMVQANEDAFQRALAEGGPRGGAMDAHLRLQRAMNLTPLLERLDGATMRHGVEGRTPFADSVVMALADQLPMGLKFQLGEGGEHRSKIALREAFRRDLPSFVVDRPKASFPMPFERWSSPLAVAASRSEFVAQWIRADVLAAVAQEPEKHWKLSWLVANLGLFGEAAFDAPISPVVVDHQAA